MPKIKSLEVDHGVINGYNVTSYVEPFPDSNWDLKVGVKYVPVEGGEEQTCWRGFNVGDASVSEILAESIKINESVIDILRNTGTTGWTLPVKRTTQRSGVAERSEERE